jgi:flagellin-specific chaperone FliS
MLISLYDAAIGKLQQALKALQENEHGTAALQLLHASRLVFGIKLGLNMDYGDVPHEINRLCQYVDACVIDASLDRVESAIRVLTSLRDAFVEIRAEAIDMERDGKIPRFEDATSSGVLA